MQDVLLMNMPLDNLVQVITEENKGSLIDVITPHDRAWFRWAVTYTLHKPLGDPLTGRTIFDHRLWFEGVFESDNGTLYLLRQPNWDGEIDYRSASIEEDKRYELFKSKALYKAFFNALNKALKERRLTNEEYIEVKNFIDSGYKKKRSPFYALFFGPIGGLKELQKHPLVAKYLQEIKSYAG